MKSEQNQGYNIAFIGDLAGSVEATLDVLNAREFPVAEIFPLAVDVEDEHSLMFSGKPVYVKELAGFEWDQIDIAFFLDNIELSQEYADLASEHCVVIDNTGAFLSDASVPLIQPGISDFSALAQAMKIAIPSAESAQLALTIKQLHQEVGLVRVSVSSYQSVSVLGKKGVTTLAGETARLLNAKEIKSSPFPQQSAFNVFPQVGELSNDGHSFSELRLVNEVRQLLNDPSIVVSSTQVVVPMFYGCAQSVHLQTHYPVDLEEIAQTLHHTDGIKLMKSVCDYPHIIDDVIGNEEVQVGRLRQDICDASGVNLWTCADSVYFGVATNAVKVAEKLITGYI